MRNERTRNIFFVVLAASLVFVSSGLLNQPIPTASKLFSADGTPCKALCDLLAKTGIEHDNTIATIVRETQKKWLRPAGVERYELSDTNAEKREELWSLFVKVGLVDDCYPSQKSYDYCLVLGATVSTVRVRLAYVVKLWREGVRFKQLVFLTGARVLEQQIESVSALCDADQTVLPIRFDWQWDQNNAPKTETEMMKLIYNQAQLPTDLRDLGVTVIDTPQQVTKDGALRRPNTADTVAAWLETQPIPGLCLVISNQPFVGFQDAVVRTIVPESFAIETVGTSNSSDYNATPVYLDSLVRWLYQEQVRVTKKI